MSVLPSLRASAQSSTSTILSLARPIGGSAFSSARSASPYVQLRQLSSTSSTRAPPKEKTTVVSNFTTKARSVQDVEKELEEQRQMLSRAARANPGMDVGMQTLPILESYVDPKLSPLALIPWGRGAERKQYLAERRERSSLTRQSMSEIVGRSGFVEHRNTWLSNGPAPLRNIWLMLRRSKTIPKTMELLNKRYQEYMRVQAEGTVGQAVAISKDNALASATSVIRGRRDKLKWQLIKENEKPYLVSARLTIVDPRDMRMAAQMVVRFDTEQALISQKGNATPTRKTQRVVENIIYELFPVSIKGDWKIKGKLVEAPAAAAPAQA